MIKERIARIKESLRQIDYNAGRYTILETQPSLDTEIRDFQGDLRACTEGELTGSDDSHYSEAKFLQVKRIIDRFRGREGLTEQDRRWSAKVTDVRNWFLFAASERWREDDSEFEHYSDSGGKSGGRFLPIEFRRYRHRYRESCLALDGLLQTASDNQRPLRLKNREHWPSQDVL